ncbi:MAG: glycoside hydrolase family 2 TIM barrel-domain containing protein [Mariniphaga sp.]
MRLIQLIALLLINQLLFAQQTETRYLSGTGADHTVNWEFLCSAGMNSGKWTTIAVPSCWEQQGFGAYNYGHDKFEKRVNETGTYKYNFSVPSTWKNKQVVIVFDGVMTDAQVKINGTLAGPIHQGAFYQFKYDVTKLLKFGKDNQLEVFVKKHSDNLSVNKAERDCDFWVFGGIFRPVYLEAKQVQNIQRVAIDAQASGDFNADVYLSNLKPDSKVIVEIQSLNGKVETSFESPVTGPMTHVSGKLVSPKTWNPEYPNLYTAIFKLVDKDNKVVHQISKQIGFRTVEVRAEDGVYVNNVRIKMQGVCRHTFTPKYGRTSSKAISIEVVNLIKDMNMNAVRMSHYPPDEHFLAVCDSLGLLVLDELTGWQKSYDETVGRKLVEELVVRDVNHPCVIFWDNGNEGGENNLLNDDYARFDIQKREVLHPWQDFRMTNTLHYADYNNLSLDGYSKRKIYFPTEFLHGLYDGGLGAGLDDYWLRMWNDPLCAGGFFWVFADEGVERTDKNRELDTSGNNAPDGILGPNLEKEGSFYTIKEIWSPLNFEKRYITPEFNGVFHIENRYFYTNLNQCKLTAEWVSLSNPDQSKSENIQSKEELKIDLAPQQKGILQLKLPTNWQSMDVLRIKMIDQYGRFLNTWSWPVKSPVSKVKELVTLGVAPKPVLQENESELKINVANLNLVFNKTDGTLKQVKQGDQLIPLSNGPLFVSREKKVTQVQNRFEGNDLIIQTLYDNKDEVKWQIRGDGLIGLDVTYDPGNNSLFAGITFSFPEANVAGMKWLGDGPYRVYKNRMKGTEFGVWEKAYNNSVTGESGYIYPEFKGYHAEVYWAKILGKGVPDFKVYIESKDIFLRMLTPTDSKFSGKAKIEYPKGDISFLHSINAIGTKFTDAASSGPQSMPTPFNASKIQGGKLNMKLWFDFR